MAVRWLPTSSAASGYRGIGAAMTREPERGKLKNLYCVKSAARKRLVEMVID
jgi:hypothetical protein